MKNIDIFSHPIKLHLNGLYDIKSSIGGYFTFITIIAMFLFAWFTGNDIFYKQIPKTYQEKITMDKSNTIEFLKNANFIFFQVFDGDKNLFIDPSILNLRMVYKISLNSKLVNTTTFKLNECNRTHFPDYESVDNKTKILYNQVIGKRYYCPEFKDKFYLYGSWIEQNLTYLQVAVYPCQNETDGGICKSQEEIDNTIWNNRLFFSFYYPLLSVGLNNYYDPFSYSYREDYFYLPKTDVYKFYTYGIDFVFINTDWGYIKPDFSYKNAYNLALITNDQRRIKTSDPYFFSIDILSTFSKNYYARSYIKITDILSSCGGMFNSVALFFIVLNSFFFKLEITKVMIDKLFVFKDPNRPLTQEYNKLKVYNKFLNELNDIENKKNKDLKVKSQSGDNTKDHLMRYKKDKNNNRIFYNNSNSTKDVNYKETNFIFEGNEISKHHKNNPESGASDKYLFETSGKVISHKNNKGRNSPNESKHLRSDTIKEKVNSPSFPNNRSKNETYYSEEIDILKEDKYNNSNTKKLINNSKNKKKFKSIKEIDHSINNANLNAEKKKNPRADSSKLTPNEKSKKLKSNKNFDDQINKIKIERTESKDFNKLIQLPVPDVNDPNFKEVDYHKRYFFELLKARSKSDKLTLSFFHKFKYNFCRCFYKKKHLKSYDSKLYYLLDEYSKKTESYFDYMKLIKNYHETEILKEILLEEHQKNILEIIKRKTIEIPKNSEEIEEFSLNDSYEKSMIFNKNVSIEVSIENLFEKLCKEEKYIKKKPFIKVNHNLVEYIRRLK